jgi:hypothetical protein
LKSCLAEAKIFRMAKYFETLRGHGSPDLLTVNVARIIAPYPYHFAIAVWRAKAVAFCRMKYWEITSLRAVDHATASTVDSQWQTIWIAAAHRGDEQLIRAGLFIFLFFHIAA